MIALAGRVPRPAARPSLLLRVPSVLVPHGSNYLFNLLHADASKAKIVRAEAANHDGRLFRAKPNPTES
jgi:hypothetical protein